MKSKYYALCFTLAILSLPVHANAGIIEFLFPTLRQKGPDPSQTLVAPFAQGTQTEDGEVEKPALPVNDIPLDKPHRVTREITNWVATAGAEAMNFTSDDYKQDIEGSKHLFSSNAQSQYEKFLRSNNIYKVLETKRYKVRSYVENTPLLLNEGVIDKRYRWLYQIPVIVTYMDRNADSYQNAKPINQKAMITMQVGRVKDSKNPEAVVIENWSGTLQAINKENKKAN